jgi:hypothetical protein
MPVSTGGCLLHDTQQLLIDWQSGNDRLLRGSGTDDRLRSHSVDVSSQELHIACQGGHFSHRGAGQSDGMTVDPADVTEQLGLAGSA